MSDEPLVSTKDRPGEYDAFETAKPGEPIFTLQGGDPLAPGTVMFWAEGARKAAFAEEKPARARLLLTKATNAEFVAWAMTDYQRGADFIAGQEELRLYESADPTDRNVILARGCDRLHNCLAEANDFAQQLHDLDEFAAERGKIREAVELLRSAAKRIEPRRHLRDRGQADG